MMTLIYLLLMFQGIWPQRPPAPIGGGGGGGGISFANQVAYSAASQSITISRNGSTVLVYSRACANFSCASTPGCTVAAADGTNTYTIIPGASISNQVLGVANANFYYSTVLQATNVLAGAYTLTMSMTGAGCTLAYNSGIFVEVEGAHSSGSIDTSGSGNSGPLDQTSFSAATTGNVSAGSEGALMFLGYDGGPTTSCTAPFSFLIGSAATQVGGCQYLSPPSGSHLTGAATGDTTTGWAAGIVVVKP